MEWRPVKNYEGIYEVSVYGEIKSLKRSWNSGVNLQIKKSKDEHIMIQMLKKTGYYKISLVKNGIQEIKNVHRIVAESFIPNTENKPCINHINGIKTDNRVENLEWCTIQENTIHAYKNGLITAGKRGKHSHARKIKCTTLDIEFDCIKDAAESLDASEYSISKICNDKQKQTKGLNFRFI